MIEPNLPLLIDAISTAWTRCLPPPYGDGSYSAAQDKMTDCNRFVHEVMTFFGYMEFYNEAEKRPKLANEMVAYMSNHPEQWKVVKPKLGQIMANLGFVVIAGWRNLDGGHGHVNIVRPGRLVSSGKWKSTEVPMVANVGQPDLCRLDRGANYSFGEAPLYFVHLETV